MSSVWWARHELIGRDVALKLSPALRDEQIVGRFVREAKIIGKFQHRNIVGVVDAGELQDEGYLFLALELLRGSPFADRLLPNKPLPPEEVVPILIEVCCGLEAAHAEGVVHRDIKPENIVMAVVPGEGVVPKIVDFGISQITGGSDTITIEGQLLGTPSYMSPEQALGKRSVDARTDLWAVGVMLYEALSGVQPFKADNHHAVLRRIIESEPPPLPSAIPARLRAIVSRCLEKDPARRYQHAAALRADLEAALDDLGASSPAPLALVSRAGAGSRAARTTQAPGALAAPAEHRFRALLRRALSLAEERFRATTRGRTTRTTRERTQSTQKTRAQGEARRRALALTALQIAGAAAIAAAATSAALREPAGEEPREPAPQSLRPVLAAAFAGGSAAKQGGAFTPGGVTRAGVPAGAEVSCDDEAGSPGSAPAGPAGGATALASSGDNPARAISPARGTRRSRITSPGF